MDDPSPDSTEATYLARRLGGTMAGTLAPSSKRQDPCCTAGQSGRVPWPRGADRPTCRCPGRVAAGIDPVLYEPRALMGQL